MVKTLTKVGNSYAIIIDRSIMQAMGMGPETQVDLRISAVGSEPGIVIQPLAPEDRRAKVACASKRANKKYSAVFEKLAE